VWITVDDTNLSIIRWDNMNVSHNFLESLWKQWFMIISLGRATKEDHSYMAVCQNLVPLVNIKIAGKWMFIPLKMVLIGIDPYPYLKNCCCIFPNIPIPTSRNINGLRCHLRGPPTLPVGQEVLAAQVVRLDLLVKIEGKIRRLGWENHGKIHHFS